MKKECSHSLSNLGSLSGHISHNDSHYYIHCCFRLIIRERPLSTPATQLSLLLLSLYSGLILSSVRQERTLLFTKEWCKLIFCCICLCIFQFSLINELYVTIISLEPSSNNSGFNVSDLSLQQLAIEFWTVV